MLKQNLDKKEQTYSKLKAHVIKTMCTWIVHAHGALFSAYRADT